MFTDGDFNVGVTDDKRLEDYVADKRGTGIYLSVYGFGRGNYQDARMQTIAQAGNGVAAYVDNLDEARRLFGPAFDRGAFPIADDVKIQVEFNPARVSEYRLIGYETRLLNEEDFANDPVDAGEVGSGASVTALYEITPVGGPSQIPERRYDGNRRRLRRRRRRSERRGRLRPGPLQAAGPADLAPDPAGRCPTRRRAGLSPAAGDAPAGPWPSPPSASGCAAIRGWRADFDWTGILDLAQGARGEDPYGERAEFVQMVRAAETLPGRAAP